MSKSIAKRRGHGVPARYDPERGVKDIAIAEAAERHARRARDPDKLAHAVEVKLTAQRDFVLWWDGQEKHPGSRKGVAVTDLLQPKAGTNHLPDRMTISRWRRRLKAEEDFAATLQMAIARCVMICEAARHMAAAQNTGVSDWFTPAEILALVRRVLGEIDLDPASHDKAQEVVQAKAYYTAEQDGLAQPWSGRVFLNPPYSQPLVGKFCNKLLAELGAGHVVAAITLTNNATETEWGQALLGSAASACFPAGRLEFWAPGRESHPLQGQMLCYFGDAHGRFRETFRSMGAVLQGTR